LLTMDRAFAAFRHVIALGAVIRDQSRRPQWQILGLRFSYPSALGTGTQTARRLLRRPRGFVEKSPEIVLCTLSHNLTKSAGEREQFVHYAIAMEDKSNARTERPYGVHGDLL